MESSRYKAFSITAKEGSFTKAAEVMHYSPSGVSQLVQALEKELGFALVKRNRRGVSLTQEGEEVLPIIRDLLTDEEKLNQITSSINGLSLGVINLGSYPSVASHWLPKLISKFTKKYPGIKINTMEGLKEENEEWLDAKLTDLAFISYSKKMHYDWIPLRKDEMVAVLPKDHPFAGGEYYELKNVKDESFIMPGLGRDADVLNLFEKTGLSPNIAFSTLENYSALALIEEGMGMSIMNDLITRNYRCDVVKLPLHPREYITLGIAVPSLDTASPAVRTFIDFAKKELRK